MQRMDWESSSRINSMERVGPLRSYRLARARIWSTPPNVSRPRTVRSLAYFVQVVRNTAHASRNILCRRNQFRLPIVYVHHVHGNGRLPIPSTIRHSLSALPCYRSRLHLNNSALGRFLQALYRLKPCHLLTARILPGTASTGTSTAPLPN